MKTKNEVIEFVKSELSSNNTLVIATLGNGGSGLDLMQTKGMILLTALSPNWTGIHLMDLWILAKIFKILNIAMKIAKYINSLITMGTNCRSLLFNYDKRKDQ